MFRNWPSFFKEEKEKPYFRQLFEKLGEERGRFTVYPPKGAIFRAFQLTAYEEVRVVLLGQDPYHGEGQADGLAFSVPVAIPLPPSLQNIIKAIQIDYPTTPWPTNGSLEAWAEQGVFLLNSVLSVRAGSPNSHRELGWEIFTDQVLRYLNEHPNPLIFLLWGKYAQQKEALITHKHHVIFKAPHPSPLSAHRGFFQAHHFLGCNQTLEAQGREPIDWAIA